MSGRGLVQRQRQPRTASAQRTPLLRLSKKPLVRRKAQIVVGAPTEDQQVHQGAESLCQHPDAVRRRLEQLEWQRQRAQEQARLSQGSKWHEAPSSMVTCSSPDEYRQLLARAAQENRLLVAKFFTEDCYVCKSLYPKMRKIAADHSDVLWAKLNGNDPELVSLFQSLGITKVPLFHMVRDGQLVAELSASLSPDKLAAFRAELMAHKPARTTTSPGHLGSPGASQDHAKDGAREEQQRQQQQQQHEEEMMALTALVAPQVA